MKLEVYNLRDLPFMESCDIIRVDRGTRWGNPFIIGPDGDRESVVLKFRLYAEWRLTIQPDWLDPLKGKHLACWCSPMLCHGDVLLQLANK